MSHLYKVFAIISIGLFSANLMAAECNAKSTQQITPLLELYTSEGCSSCPPADLWLRGLNIAHANLVPLAFHVDYWNYIGWADRFAKPEFSERQRKLAAQGGLGFVYTPQFILNSRDLRHWNDARLMQGITSIQQQLATITLHLNFSEKANGEAFIHAMAQPTSSGANKQADIYVAIYENKLSSLINAGENKGLTLAHDYVVRQLFGPYTFDNSDQLNKTFILKSEWKARDAGVVMFAQNKGSGSILQSLQLAFCH